MSRVMAAPCTEPHAAPTAQRGQEGIDDGVARLLGGGDGEAVVEPALGDGRPAPVPASATMEPTDRSMPAVRMTNVMPTATRPMMETCRRMFIRLSGCRKRGSSSAKSAISTSRKSGAA
ncbi:MAG: hypothetical protein AcusKO_28710 [Acuticoccus sp.]